YWVTERDARDNLRIVLDGDTVREHIRAKRIRLVNASRIPEAEKNRKKSLIPIPNFKTFAQSEREARTHRDFVDYAVDMRMAREWWIRPIPAPDVIRYLEYWLAETHHLNLKGFKTTVRHTMSCPI